MDWFPVMAMILNSFGESSIPTSAISLLGSQTVAPSHTSSSVHSLRELSGFRELRQCLGHSGICISLPLGRDVLEHI